MDEVRDISTRTEALDFLQEYCDYGGDRVYVFELSARRKENEDLKDNGLPNFTRVIDSCNEMVSVFNEFCALMDAYEFRTGEQPKFRMYITVNARDSQKAFYTFQEDLLRMNQGLANGDIGSKARISRLDSEWRSTIHSSEHKLDGRFLFDIDTEDTSEFDAFRTALAEETTIIEQIKTPNGFHLITEKFNYTEFTPLENADDIELKRDEEIYVYSE